ncbi:MAG: hypothetical protein Q4E53_12985 [Eubacteriales bacterium]|nr:hypothetical protein [Eubacteriales bacterium]
MGGRFRMMSHGSVVYHRKGCHYAKRIKYRKGIDITSNEDMRAIYRPCKYCNSMKYAYDFSKDIMRYYEENKGIKFKYMDSILYILTEMGCWKLIYSEQEESIVIYHRNKSSRPVKFEEPYNERYHLQRDAIRYSSITGALKYIYEHDRFRKAQEQHDKNFKYISKKYKKQAKRKERRDAVNRVNDLFRLLENQDKNLIQYSFC